MSRHPADEKTELRARMRRLRQALTPEERDAFGASAAVLLVATRPWQEAAVIYLYDAAGAEMPTHALAEAAVEAGKTICYPRVAAEALAFHEAPRSALERSFAGIREPPADAPAGPPPDLVVVPCLAVDRHGHRLGRGGGHYDRFLRALPETVPLVALCYPFQVVPRVPREPHDHPVGLVVDGEQVLPVAPGQLL